MSTNSKKKINSKVKGDGGEREWAKYLRDHGIGARRGVQYQGGPGSPDVVSELDNVHFEVKRVERLNIYKAMKQAKEDAGTKFAMVAHRKNHKKWLLTMTADDFMKILKEKD